MPAAATLIRQAGRALRRRPLYATIAAVTVAAGIAASTASFVLVDAALLAPLPFREPESLVTPNVISSRGFEVSLAMPIYDDWAARNHSLAAVGGSAGWTVVHTGEGLPRVLEVRQVYGDFLPLLGLKTAHGRLFGADEAKRGAAPIVVLGSAFFRELGGNPLLVGESITLDGKAHTVVGVLAPGAGYPNAEVAAYLPLGALGDSLPWDNRESSFGLRMIGRLKPGVTVEEAAADFLALKNQLEAEQGRPEPTPELVSLGELLVGDLRQPLWLLFAAAALVVLLAVGNVANLFLARAEARRDELTVRGALGAPRFDFLRLQLAESGWIALAGALAGLAGSFVLIRWISGFVARDLPGFVAARLALGPRAALFAGLLAVVIALALGVLPALGWVRRHAGNALQGQRASATRQTIRFRKGLVIAQLALGTVLTIGASLFGASLERLRAVDKGFESEGLVIAQLGAPRGYFKDGVQQWRTFHDTLVEKTRGLPGATSTSVSLLAPLSDRSWERGVLPEDVPYEREKEDSVLYNIVSPDHFATYGVKLLRGRVFDSGDVDGAEPVTVVDETLADRYWPGQDPLGKRVTFEKVDNSDDADAKPLYRRVVGVVKNVRHYEVQKASRIQVYIPMAQTLGRCCPAMELAVKSTGDLAPIVQALPSMVAAVDRGVPLRRVRTAESVVDSALAQPQLLARVARLLSAIALVLAGVGIFAVATYGVAARRRELGLRQALGATPMGVLMSILKDALRWCGLGVAIGVVAAAGVSQLASALLWGIGKFEILAYLGAISLLAGLSLLAALLPALQAMRIQPSTILREEV